MSVAFLFPGQGSQQPDMLHTLPNHTRIRETLDEASTVLKRDVLSLDTEVALSSTPAVQLSLLISGVAQARALIDEGGIPSIVAGHSIGSFAAAVVAGALKFSDAVSVVELRGQLMAASYPKGYGMAVIVGLQEKTVLSLIDKASTSYLPVFIATLNALDQITIAGCIESIKVVLTLARSIGAQKSSFLRVSVPSHCPLLNSVSEEISSKMDNITFNSTSIPYISNCRARSLRRAEDIKKDLSLGVANPVRWHESTTLAFELGARLFVEIGPGQVLTNMAQKAFPTTRAITTSYTDFESTIILIKREMQQYT
ncbi:malonate decarboxylase subunit epsilon [Clostridium estertheticum]|uniref:malonate decarboxylase subunit epsilon n=1 Tax=Clostridium estertheticum TaxID=238834 RepID=UPI001CF3A0FB|nr:malonate decarboxylase subunit epsilon [Clostridium estertheticum]MCB2308192.1 malonate decarboxylase subunit epsilon [Clostridium estertheticum]MCB2346229.1 malonate decarboxylase subunit epsilon [Clostridium estertheticum]MCB2349579.1 malonate decarboxylase subunit epsilon [Clostridium estertheticum]WAG46549.1 malonate decarboxylase subunit epsilon [Clostridium estertheticum]